MSRAVLKTPARDVPLSLTLSLSLSLVSPAPLRARWPIGADSDVVSEPDALDRVW